MVTPGPSTLILCASDRLQKAREVDSLKGSFLAHECEAIISTMPRLTVIDLVEQLQDRARHYNEVNPSARVPIPYVIGEIRREFFLRRFTLLEIR